LSYGACLLINYSTILIPSGLRPETSPDMNRDELELSSIWGGKNKAKTLAGKIIIVYGIKGMARSRHLSFR